MSSTLHAQPCEVLDMSHLVSVVLPVQVVWKLLIAVTFKNGSGTLRIEALGEHILATCVLEMQLEN
jgi:hypothetical protein